jgi:flagellum-specific ATP synthase
VLLLLDSVTRFAAAQREIGLAADEPPTVRAYPPSVFSRLSGLLERSGPGTGRTGDITAVYTVLVEGDDQNEPVSDTVRAILDGHVVLDRSIAERGRFPAIDVLRSVSRALPGCHSAEENELLRRARKYIADANDMLELSRIGAYRKGTDPSVDLALAANEALEALLAQDAAESVTLADSFAQLAEVLQQAEAGHQAA